MTAMRDIPGHEGRYAVTDDGRVWSYPKEGKGRGRKHSGIWLAQATYNGYSTAVLRSNSTSKTWRVHRLVAMAWIPNPRNLPQINHINSNKKDNRVANLEWCTPAENIRHALLRPEVLAERRSAAKRANAGMRAMYAALTHCKRGHLFQPDAVTKLGRRFCRVCVRLRHHQRKAATK